MLYLAQVHKNDFLVQYQLRLLARQESENFWLTISEETLILLGKGHATSNNLLVLVKLSSTGEIEKIEDLLPASSTKKIYGENFSVLDEKFMYKFCCVYRKHDFCLCLLLVGLRPGLNPTNKKRQFCQNFLFSVNSNRIFK